MKKLEEQKKRKEAERRLRREQRLADMQKKQLEETERAPQEPQGPPKQSRYVYAHVNFCQYVLYLTSSKIDLSHFIWFKCQFSF